MANNHSLEVNKIAASILLAGILAMVAGFVADGLYSPTQPKERGYSIDVPETPAAGEAAVAEVDIGTLLASADAAAGEDAAKKKCTSCHTFEAGGANKVGPNLNGVVGSQIGHHAAGFAYSPALSGHGGSWGYDELNHWLKSPAGFAKGNKMAYAGVKKDEERANIIAYLKSISSGAPAYPAPKAPEAAPAAAPAAEAAPAPAAH